MLLKVPALLAVALIALPVFADDRMQPYCEIYRDTLEDVVYDHRRGYPDYSESMHASDRLRQDAAFVFQQSKGFDFEGWIQGRYQACWEETPLGPDSGERIVISAGARLLYAIRTASVLGSRVNQSQTTQDDARQHFERALAEVIDIFPQYASVLKGEHEMLERYPSDDKEIQIRNLRKLTSSVEEELSSLFELSKEIEIEEFDLKYMKYMSGAASRHTEKFNALEP